MKTAELRHETTNGGLEGRFNLRMAECDHRVANSLNLTATLLRMQRERAGNEVVEAALLSAEARVISIAKFHAYLHRRGSDGRVNLANAFIEILPEMSAAIGVRCLLAVDATDTLKVSKRVARQVLIIVNELALNARKHAYQGRDGGCISVELGAEGAEGFRIAVADSGPGLPACFNAAKGGGLGLRIVSSLVEELGGTMRCRSDGGARFTISIPFD